MEEIPLLLDSSIAAPDGRSGFLRGDRESGDAFEAMSDNAGVRYAW